MKCIRVRLLMRGLDMSQCERVKGQGEGASVFVRYLLRSKSSATHLIVLVAL